MYIGDYLAKRELYTPESLAIVKIRGNLPNGD